MKKPTFPSALAKAFTLAALLLLALLPLAAIHGQIESRASYRQQAAAELARSHAGEQVLLGPLLVLPYVERWTEEQRDEAGTVKARAARSRASYHLLHPERLDLRGRLAGETRTRGLFAIPFFRLDGTLAGRFPAFDPAALPRAIKGSQLELQPPVLALALGDVRGLQGAPRARIAGAEARWLPRVPGIPEGTPWLSGGIHAPLPAAALQAWEQQRPFDFHVDLTLVGQQRLAVVPLADETTAQLASDWPHPSFGGEFLATRRTVGPQGFEAQWAVPSLVSSARAQLAAATRDGGPREPRAPAPAGPALDSFDVALIEPLDVYALTARATGYGVLFVAVILGAAFLFEVFRRLPLHPIQYGLVALSLALFFLLLLALAEKIPFGAAYALAAGASVLLLATYFGAVLRGWRRGAGLGAFIAVLYAALYGLLVSEDDALLLGSLLLFGLLAAFMLLTRRVDWRALGGPREAPSA